MPFAGGGTACSFVPCGCCSCARICDQPVTTTPKIKTQLLKLCFIKWIHLTRTEMAVRTAHEVGYEAKEGARAGQAALSRNCHDCRQKSISAAVQSGGGIAKVVSGRSMALTGTRTATSIWSIL
jgi:hypothetical protein